MKHSRYLPLITLALAVQAHAGDVYLRVTAFNRDRTNKIVEIKSYLPPDVRPQHIRDLGGTELAYDVRRGAYYVHAARPLPPKVANTYSIRFHDIWIVPTQYIGRIERHLEALQAQLGEDSLVAEEIAGRAINEVKEIRACQLFNAAERVAIEKHIKAYQLNILALEKVVNACRRLEDMAISRRLDPGWLVPYFFRPKSTPNPGGAGERRAVIRVSVGNTSPAEPRAVDVRRELPFEVTPDDVLSAGGLVVGTDVGKGVCYVATNRLELAAQETRTFDVTIRDRWNVNAERMGSMLTGLTTDLSDVRKLKRYASVEESLEQLVSDLSDIRDETGPAELSARYVAFYRTQTRRLDAIEAMWKRIQRIEFPSESIIRPPDRKQTWLIIYTILGFLALVSMIVILSSVCRKGGSGSSEQ